MYVPYADYIVYKYGSSLIQVGAPNYSGIQRSRCVHIRVLEILGESMFNWPKIFSVTNMSLKYMCE